MGSAFKVLQMILIVVLLVDILCQGITMIIGNGMSEMQKAKLTDGIYVIRVILICLGVTILMISANKDRKAQANQPHLMSALICCTIVEGALLIFQESLIYLLLGPLVLFVFQSMMNYYWKEGKIKCLMNGVFTALMSIFVYVTIYPLCKLIYDSLGENTMLFLGVLEGLGAYLVAVSFMGLWTDTSNAPSPM